MESHLSRRVSALERLTMHARDVMLVLCTQLSMGDRWNLASCSRTMLCFMFECALLKVHVEHRDTVICRITSPFQYDTDRIRFMKLLDIAANPDTRNLCRQGLYVVFKGHSQFCPHETQAILEQANPPVKSQMLPENTVTSLPWVILECIALHLGQTDLWSFATTCRSLLRIMVETNLIPTMLAPLRDYFARSNQCNIDDKAADRSRVMRLASIVFGKNPTKHQQASICRLCVVTLRGPNSPLQKKFHLTVPVKGVVSIKINESLLRMQPCDFAAFRTCKVTLVFDAVLLYTMTTRPDRADYTTDTKYESAVSTQERRLSLFKKNLALLCAEIPHLTLVSFAPTFIREDPEFVVHSSRTRVLCVKDGTVNTTDLVTALRLAPSAIVMCVQRTPDHVIKISDLPTTLRLILIVDGIYSVYPKAHVWNRPSDIGSSLTILPYRRDMTGFIPQRDTCVDITAGMMLSACRMAHIEPPESIREYCCERKSFDHIVDIVDYLTGPSVQSLSRGWNRYGPPPSTQSFEVTTRPPHDVHSISNTIYIATRLMERRLALAVLTTLTSSSTPIKFTRLKSLPYTAIPIRIFTPLAWLMMARALHDMSSFDGAFWIYVFVGMLAPLFEVVFPNPHPSGAYEAEAYALFETLLELACVQTEDMSTDEFLLVLQPCVYHMGVDVSESRAVMVIDARRRMARQDTHMAAACLDAAMLPCRIAEYTPTEGES